MDGTTLSKTGWCTKTSMIGNSGGEAVVDECVARAVFLSRTFFFCNRLLSTFLSFSSFLSTSFFQIFFFQSLSQPPPYLHLASWSLRLIMFAPDKWEILSEVNSVFCITFVCFFLGRKLSSAQGPAHYARILVTSLFVVSWAFNLISTLLISTNNNNFTSCSLSIFMCITLYAMSKILIYLFLIEKASGNYFLDFSLCILYTLNGVTKTHHRVF